MSFTFINPLFLFGLAAGILPILIHRLTRRKAIVRKFSAVRLLLQSQRQMAKPQRLRHLLLLALRVLAVMTAAFLMAQPILMRQGILASDKGAKVIILDNSRSMGYRDERGLRYDLAKDAVREIIGNLKGDFIFIPSSPVRGRSLSNDDFRWRRANEAIRDLDSIPLSFGRGDPGAALSLAYQELKDLKVPKEILIVSDMAKGDWDGFDLSKLGSVSNDTGITFLRIGGSKRDPNFAIKEVSLAEGDAVVNVPTRIEVTVSNFSDKPGTPVIQLYLSGAKVDQKSAGIEAGKEGKAYFELFLDKPGWLDGEVKLSGDRLALDDTFYFPLKVREKIRVLVVDGNPRPSFKSGESYYLVNALDPGGSEGSPFVTRVITDEEVAGIDLKPYEAIFLLNVSRPQGSKLASFLESGKPVFMFLGNRVIPEEYHSLSFFPWRIREVKETEAARTVKISQVDETCWSLKPFIGSGGASLKGASFRRYFRIEGNTKSLLTLENKDPLLVRADLRKGSLFLFASSADLDWNDLPLKTAYLPLIQGLLKETVGLTRDSLPKTVRFGEPFEEKVTPAQVAGPQEGPGIYKFILQSGEMRRGVNVPLEESDLSKMTQEEMRKKFGNVNTKVVEYQKNVLAGLHGYRKELWPFFLALLLLVLATEMVVANGFPWKRS